MTLEPARNPIVLSFVRDLEEPEAVEEGAESEDVDPAADDPMEDPAVRLADEILTRYGSIDGAKMLTDSRVLLAVRAREADAEAVKRLAETGVDWTVPAPADVGAPSATPLEDGARRRARSHVGASRAGREDQPRAQVPKPHRVSRFID